MLIEVADHRFRGACRGERGEQKFHKFRRIAIWCLSIGLSFTVHLFYKLDHAAEFVFGITRDSLFSGGSHNERIACSDCLNVCCPGPVIVK